MTEQIINRVANSKLIVIDIETLYPEGKRIILDIKTWLYEGIVLREKEFRAYVDAHNWSQYKDCYVAMHCSTDAIVPDWAYMLIASVLQPFARRSVIGSLETLENVIFTEIVNTLDSTKYKDVPIIITGCSKKPVPLNALVLLTQKLQPLASSIMFGEACSSVPVFKRKKD